MAHAEVFLLTIWSFDNANSLRNGVASLWENFDNPSCILWTNHDLMLLEEGVLVNETENVTARDHASDLEFPVRLEGPQFILVKTWKFNTSWDEHTFGLFGNFFQWSLNSIENCFQNTYD